MYLYRTLTSAQKREILAYRQRRGLPLHAPPHYPGATRTYMLTAACFEHQPVLLSEPRRRDFALRLLTGLLDDLRAKVFAWVVLPDHYHLLAEVDLALFRTWLRTLHAGTATQWNREDDRQGRRIWYRFADREVRNERHFFASVNYLHLNPVKHRWVACGEHWPESSIHEYLRDLGRSRMQAMAREYRVGRMGSDWDD